MASTLAPTGLVDPHVDARRSLDAEINRVETRLVSLKVTRNTLAPIARLHREILQEIFAITHIASSSKGKTSLLLSWVSHYWRELARDTSALWTRMDITIPECVEVFLSRIKFRELEFAFKFEPNDSDVHVSTLVGSCLVRLSRTKVLEITSNPMLVMQTVTQWTLPASNLVELTLEKVFLPPNIFSGSCPALQRLSLTSCGLDWDTLPPMPSLKALGIMLTATRPSIDILIQLLGRVASHLEELVLRYAFSKSPPSTVLSSPVRVELPKLRLLNMDDGDLDSIVQLLDRIAVPNLLDIDFSLPIWGQARVAQALVSARNVTKWEIEHLRIGFNPDDGGTTISVTDFKPNDASPISKTRFIMDEHDIYQDVNILAFFSIRGRVKKLSLDTSLLRGLLAFVEDENAETISFSDLKVLELVRGTSKSDTIPGKSVKNLHEWLRIRSRAGHGLGKLVLTGLDPSQLGSSCGMFGDVVDEVEGVNV